MTTSINGDWKTSEFYKIDGKFWRVGTKNLYTTRFCEAVMNEPRWDQQNPKAALSFYKQELVVTALTSTYLLTLIRGKSDQFGVKSEIAHL